MTSSMPVSDDKSTPGTVSRNSCMHRWRAASASAQTKTSLCPYLLTITTQVMRSL